MHSSSVVTGIILKRSNYHEADKLLTLFTLELGKITVLAKGIRKATSRRSPSLQLFNLVKINLVSTSTPLSLITESQLLTSFSTWQHQIGRVTIAYELCELVDKLSADRQPHPQIFNLLTTYLSTLSTLGPNWRRQVNEWLVTLVSELGYLPANPPFTGDIHKLVEELSERSFNSPKLLTKLTLKK